VASIHDLLSEIIEGCSLAEAATNAGYLLLMMKSISNADIKKIARNLNDLAKSTDHLRDVTEADTLIKAMMPMDPTERQQRHREHLKELHKLKESGVKDPSLDFYLAFSSAIEAKTELNREELDRYIAEGAEVNITPGELLERHSKRPPEQAAGPV
jgi:hypothetical protein